MSSRWIRFLIVIGLGLAAGLYYGAIVNPVTVVDTTPDMLRDDFRADYVLMVAEVYQAKKDLPFAARKLAVLGDSPVLEIVQTAYDSAAEIPFSQTDLALIQILRTDLQTWNPAPEDLQP